MGEGLGEVPQRYSTRGIDFLGIETKVVGLIHHPPENALRAFSVSDSKE
jgi:hypothetical protein